jgi:AcrR family transcriptional regulator
VDRRIGRTDHALRSALIALILEKGYDDLSVQDVLDRAGVARSTFYAHFKDKESLLKASVDNLKSAIRRHWETQLDDKGKQRGGLAFVLGFLQHVNGNRKLYAVLVRGEGGMIVDRHFRRMLAELTRADLAGHADGRVLDLAVEYVVGGLMALLAWWMERDARLSPEELFEMILRLQLPGLQAALGQVADAREVGTRRI